MMPLELPDHCRITGISFYPDGYDPTDSAHRINVLEYTVKVEWHGEVETDTPRPRGGYGVHRRNHFFSLSRAGNWHIMPSRMSIWQHRWVTLEEACAQAEEHRNDPLDYLGTFAECMKRLEARR